MGEQKARASRCTYAFAVMLTATIAVAVILFLHLNALFKFVEAIGAASPETYFYNDSLIFEHAKPQGTPFRFKEQFAGVVPIGKNTTDQSPKTKHISDMAGSSLCHFNSILLDLSDLSKIEMNHSEGSHQDSFNWTRYSGTIDEFGRATVHKFAFGCDFRYGCYESEGTIRMPQWWNKSGSDPKIQLIDFDDDGATRPCGHPEQHFRTIPTNQNWQNITLVTKSNLTLFFSTKPASPYRFVYNYQFLPTKMDEENWIRDVSNNFDGAKRGIVVDSSLDAFLQTLKRDLVLYETDYSNVTNRHGLTLDDVGED